MEHREGRVERGEWREVGGHHASLTTHHSSLIAQAAIYAPIQRRLDKVERRLKELARVSEIGGKRTETHPSHSSLLTPHSSPPGTGFPFLSKMLTHVYGSSGKRARPAITLLAASFHPHDEYKSEVMATAVELLHIATLIHDDTVDDSDTRRGRATISSLYGKDIAVLVGDYVFASSATFVCDTGHVGVIRRFSETIMELSSGELHERVSALRANRPGQTLEGYHQRIYNKTASLFSTSGETGAILSGAPDEQVAALKNYSRELGMAFQIVDDILDFQGDEDEIGKPVGSDLANGIMTLPAFIARETAPAGNPVDTYLEDDTGDDSLLTQAVEFIRQPSIINAAYDEAARRCEIARDALSALPKTPSRHSLEQLLDYILTRRS